MLLSVRNDILGFMLGSAEMQTSFLLYRKVLRTFLYNKKGPPGGIARRRDGNMSLTRPTAGGESGQAGFYFMLSFDKEYKKFIFCTKN